MTHRGSCYLISGDLWSLCRRTKTHWRNRWSTPVLNADGRRKELDLTCGDAIPPVIQRPCTIVQVIYGALRRGSVAPRTSDPRKAARLVGARINLNLGGMFGELGVRTSCASYPPFVSCWHFTIRALAVDSVGEHKLEPSGDAIGSRGLDRHSCPSVILGIDGGKVQTGSIGTAPSKSTID